jgi:SAM-dependent methyltransferase
MVVKKIKNILGFALNELNNKVEQYKVNFGVGYSLYKKNKFFYSERLIELPFLFSQIIKPPAQVLDVGCAESITPIQLSMIGYKVYGMDIRDYGYSHPNFTFIKGDFLTHNFGNQKFDVVINISAIEHFGLSAYKNKKLNLNADIQAINKIYTLLREKGQFIFTAPFGKHEIINNFERIYSYEDIQYMFKNKFKIKEQHFWLVWGYKKIKEIDLSVANKIKYNKNEHTYAVITINSFKI